MGNIKSQEPDKNISKTIIDVKKAYRYLTRRVDKTIWYTNDCRATLTQQEIKTVNIVLKRLYDYNKKCEEDGVRVTGIKTMRLVEELPLSKVAIVAMLWKLTPIFLEVRGYGRTFLQKARRWRLNDATFELMKQKLEVEKDDASGVEKETYGH